VHRAAVIVVALAVLRQPDRCLSIRGWPTLEAAGSCRSQDQPESNSQNDERKTMDSIASGAGTARSEKLALTNVRVFDGRELRGPTTVVIGGGILGSDPAGARVVDAGGATLLPGLIDAHVHLLSEEHLQQLADFGVTTALDMGAWPPSMVDALRHRTGMADIRSAGIPATVAGSTHSHLPGFPSGELVDGPTGAGRFVTDRIAEGADYIKLIADIPGPDQETLDALVAASHEHGKLTVAHAVSRAALDMALRAGVDMITHVPLDSPLTEPTAARILAQGCVSVPTLTMMKGIVDRFAAASAFRPEGVAAAGPSYESARVSVAELHRAGVPILAGTDANAGPGIPFSPRHGESLHQELELLIEAGLSTVEALRAATVLPAQYFGLHDRGVIEPGRRADLVLVDGDPIADIRATRLIRRVWCAGVEHGVVSAA
jgi:imidazolonepropionase-like amidohydrolase